jgi:hypothetical protein
MAEVGVGKQIGAEGSQAGTDRRMRRRPCARPEDEHGGSGSKMAGIRHNGRIAKKSATNWQTGRRIVI